MNINELMISDWIWYDNKPYQIRLLGKNIYGDDYPAVCIRTSSGSLIVDRNKIEPIPLTPEILEKNGFTKSIPPPGIHAKCYNLDNKEEKYHLTIANYNKYKRLLLNVDSEDSECFNIRCDYVHELQHALRLCGIKKEIEL